MKSSKKKLVEIWFVSVILTLITIATVLAGLGLFLGSKKEAAKKTEQIVDPLAFSTDVWDGTSFENYLTAYAGRDENTITINSAASFVKFVKEVNSGKDFANQRVCLNKNIDLNNQTIESIGLNSAGFKGTFDGGFYTIFNANIDGNGLFEYTENAEIKNLGLYNVTINARSSSKSEQVAGGLIAKAKNTNINNCFVKNATFNNVEKFGGLVGTYYSTISDNKISTSFVDSALDESNAGGLIHTAFVQLDSNKLEINECYFTANVNAVKDIQSMSSLSFEDDQLVHLNKVVNTNKDSFDGWNYIENYKGDNNSQENDSENHFGNLNSNTSSVWTNYQYNKDSKQLDFNHYIQPGFVLVYLKGSYIETVVDINGQVQEFTNINSVFKNFYSTGATFMNSTSNVEKAEINLLVEKIFMDEEAQANANVEITIKAENNATIVRGENTASLFVATGNAKIVIGQTENNESIISPMSSRTNNASNESKIVLDGNREYIEQNNLKSGALVLATNGGSVDIGDNVVLQNNINNNSIGYGGAVLVNGSTTQPIINADIYNCSATYSGGGICTIGTAPKTIGSISGCSASVTGGNAAFLEEMDNESSVRALNDRYGSNKVIKPVKTLTAETYLAPGDIIENGTAANGGGITTDYLLHFTILGGVDDLTSDGKIIFRNNKGGALNYKHTSSPLYVAYAYFENNSGGSAIKASNVAVKLSNYNVFKNNSYSGGAGGAIYCKGLESSSAGKVSFEGNSANAYGGAIYNISGATTIYNAEFVNNKLESSYSFGDGGAIFCGTFTADNCTFTGNYIKNTATSGDVKTSGGAIYCSSLANISNSTFTNNSIIHTETTSSKTIQGGAINCTRLETTGCTFTENSITSPSATTKVVQGGAVYASSTVTLNNSTFTSNTASYGGSIYGGYTVSLKGINKFNNNHAPGSGGAIYCKGLESESNSDSTFEANTAGNGGGAVYAVTSDVVIYNGKFINNSTMRLKGGAIYCEYTLSADNCTFTGNNINNSATSGNFMSMGGAIYANTATISNSTFNGNNITHTGTTGTEEIKGGAIYASSLTLSGCTFASNTLTSGNTTGSVTAQGGAVYADNITDTNSYYGFNKITVDSGVSCGGAIYTKNGTFTNIGQFNSNEAGYGGAICVVTKLEIKTTNNSFSTLNKNKATNGDGGAIYCDGGTVSISAFIQFQVNSARNGGALYVNSLTFDSNYITYFSGNNTTNMGGAIYSKTAISLANSQFTDNIAAGPGGAIYCLKTIDMYLGCSFTGNQMTTSSAIGGGAIYASGYITIHNYITFSGNTSASRGGAIFTYADFKLQYDSSYITAIFTSNIANSYGGAIYAKNLTTDKSSKLSVSGNESKTTGGAIYANGNVITNGVFEATGNKARYGGAIANATTITFNYTTTLSGNSATSEGGAVYATSLVNNGIELICSDNTAGTIGGAFALSGKFTSKAGSSAIFSANKTTASYGQGGGAIHAHSVDIYGNVNFGATQTELNTILNDSSKSEAEKVAAIQAKGNISAANGGAICTNQTTSSSIMLESGATLRLNGNSAGLSGGAIYGANISSEGSIIANYNTSHSSGGAIFSSGLIEMNCAEVSFEENKSTSGNGGAIYANGGFTMSAAEQNTPQFKNNEAVNGGAIYAPDAGLTLGGHFLGITGNKATSHGGAIYSVGQILVDSYDLNAIFSYNESTLQGGAIYCSSGIQFIGNAQFINNTAGTNGGAICSTGEVQVGPKENNSGYDYWHTVVNFGGESSGNKTEAESANGGGAVYASRFVVNAYGEATFSHNNSAARGGALYTSYFENNNIAEFNNNIAKLYGGAIYCVGAVLTTGTLTANGNKALDYAGGAIYCSSINASGDYQLNKFDFQNNEAQTEGGAIYSSGTVKLYLGNSTDALIYFYNNEARGNGGAISASDIWTIGGLFEENISHNNGGAIYTSSETTITDKTDFIGNEASNGGAVYANSSFVVEGAGGTFTGNKATQSGGAIYSKNSVDFNGNVTFKANIAVSNGGAVYAGGDVNVFFEAYFGDAADTTSGNKAGYIYDADTEDFVVSNSYANGGAVYSTRFILGESSNARFYHNSSVARGGAVYVIGVFTNNGTAEFDNNKTTSGSGMGGAVYTSSVGVNSNGTLVLKNNSSANGGAIASIGPFKTLGELTASNNHAERYGGALYIEGNVVLQDVAIFDGNTASAYGGAIYCFEMDLSEFDTDGQFEFKNNIASAAGGAIYCGGDVKLYADTMVFDGNKTTDSNGTGGGAIASGGEVRLNTNNSCRLVAPNVSVDALIINNESASRGGVIFASGKLTFTSGQFYIGDNKATSYGGAIYAGSEIKTEPQSTIFVMNNFSHQDGGAIHGRSTMLFKGCVEMFNNESRRNGGAVYSVGSLTFANGTSLQSNKAGVRGGAIYGASDINITDNSYGNKGFELFADNNNANIGGAIYGSFIHITEIASFSENEATENGGALAAGNTISFADYASTTFTKNKAGVKGGAVYTNYEFHVSATARAKFENNAVERISSSAYDFYGGAVYTDSVISISGVTEFIGNQIITNGVLSCFGYGGAIYTKSSLSISQNATFKNNIIEAQLGYGGAIYTEKTLTLTKVIDFIGNEAGNGGAIYCESQVTNSGTLNLNDNVANLNAGAIYAHNFITKAKAITNLNNNNVRYEEYGGCICQIYISGGDNSGNEGSGLVIINSNDENCADIGLNNTAYWKLNPTEYTTDNFSYSFRKTVVTAESRLKEDNLNSIIIEYSIPNDQITNYINNFTQEYPFTLLNLPSDCALNNNDVIPGSLVVVKKVDKPIISDEIFTEYYNAENITYEIDNIDLTYMTISGNVEKEPGEHTVEINLVDYAKWSDELNKKVGETSIIFVPWKIILPSLEIYQEEYNLKTIYTKYKSQEIFDTEIGLSSTFEELKALTMQNAKDGYEFVGYGAVAGDLNSVVIKADGTFVVYSGFTTNISGNVVWDYRDSNNSLYELFKPIEFTITYDLDGGTLSSANPTSYTADDTFTLNNPTKTGYTFTGWTGTGLDDKTMTVTIEKGSTGDKEFSANWEIETYSITYNLNGATIAAINPESYTVETATFTLNNPIKTGYTFLGWTGSNGTTPQTSVTIEKGSTGDKEFVANWEVITYTITYTGIEGATFEGTNPESYTVETATFTLNNPTKTGYTFTGWTGTGLATSTTTVTIAQGSTGDKEYTANWQANEYTVTFNANGGTVDTATKKVTYDSAYGDLPTPTKAGNRFMGWKLNGNSVDKDTIVKTASDHELIAEWVQLDFTLTFDVNGGDALANDEANGIKDGKKTITFGLAYGYLPTPTRTGYDFVDWKLDGASIKADTIVTLSGDHTLVAEWRIQEYSITYTGIEGATFEGTNPESYTVETATFTLNNPTKVGYTFLGWTGSNGATAETIVTIEKGSTGDKEFVANWKLISYTITYTGIEGATFETVNPTSYTVETATFTLNNPTKVGYTFTGWTGTGLATSTTTVTIAQGSTGNKEFAANWELISYTITYTGIEGATFEGTNPESYTVNDTFTLNNPTLEGFTFKGWSENDETETEKVVTIEKGSTGDKTFKAVWFVDITISANATGYKVVISDIDNNGVYDRNGNVITSITDITETFRLIRDGEYTITFYSTLTRNVDENKYQILRTYVDGNVRDVYKSSSVENSDRIPSQGYVLLLTGIIDKAHSIGFEYYNAYSLVVKLEKNALSKDIEVTTPSKTDFETLESLQGKEFKDSIVVQATSKTVENNTLTEYIIAKDSVVRVNVDATLAENSNKTYVGFTYNNSTTVGVEGDGLIKLIKLDSDNEDYLYEFTSNSISTIEIKLATIVKITLAINDAEVTSGSITVKSQDLVSKVVTADMEEVMLYAGTWKVIQNDWSFEEIQTVFTGCDVQQTADGIIITIP